MQNFLIAYDIFNQKRLRIIRKVISSYMLGGQKSVLEVPLDKKSLKCLVGDLNYFASDEDKINIISIESNPILLGKANHITLENGGIVII